MIEFQSTDIIRLRTLARKSIIWFGKHEGLSVQCVINIRHHSYLRWLYYNYEGITFVDDVLEEIRITVDRRIEKPGINPEMHDEVCQETQKLIGWKDKSHYEKVQKIRAQAKLIKRNRANTFTKSQLQAKNLKRFGG